MKRCILTLTLAGCFLVFGGALGGEDSNADNYSEALKSGPPVKRAGNVHRITGTIVRLVAWKQNELGFTVQDSTDPKKELLFYVDPKLASAEMLQKVALLAAERRWVVDVHEEDGIPNYVSAMGVKVK